MKSLRRQAKYFTKWKLLAALLGVFLAQAALATIPLYQNNDISSYEVFNNTISPNPPPTIDATAFDNESLFSVGYAAYTLSPELYETWNTVNYTNVGTMIANAPWVTNGAYIFLGIGAFGTGYQFDLQTTNVLSHQMAGTFYNPGAIRCDSVQDGNNLFNEGGAILYSVTSLGMCKVSATNVIVPGSIDVSTGGLIQLGGKNVDMTGGMLNVENLLTAIYSLIGVSTLDTVNFNSVGAVGVDTNADWNPGLDLTPAAALSSFVPITPYYLLLTNSQSYFKLTQSSTNYNLYRCVFVQNASPNAPYKVYIDDPNPSFPGNGTAYVEWDGTYIDAATGNQVVNYLYLNDDYLFGASTNVAVINGVPDNFTFFTSPNPILFNPLATGFPGFPVGYITNNYAYMNGTLTASTGATNASIVNPSGSITNLPGAIKITASDRLNLAYTTIAGASYLSLNSTNQFDGSPGAAIAAPYVDIALGVTNGFMSASNLLMGAIPNWSGNIQAWSTVWTTVDATGVTNEYRVMLVFSALQPTTSPWIQNLYLHGTNSLVISDQLNVYASFFSDARSLTLITNQIGQGATSLDGELNWLNPATFNANSASGTQQMPNLLYLTNSGAIRVLNNAYFGGPASVYGAFINNSLISDQGTTIYTTNFFNDGTVSNGTGSFALYSRMAMMTNGNLVAGADVTINATNSLVISGHAIQAGRKLTLVSTNLTDYGVTNGNIWVVGTSGVGGASDSGFNLLLKPAAGDLLGTTVTNIALPSKSIYNVWAATNYGLSTQGYSNNAGPGPAVAGCARRPL